MESEFWHERWDTGQTPWDQRDVHPLLVERWGDHVGSTGGSVFVPLCGSSIDMAWLAGRGHRVVGNELSSVALESFLSSRGVVPELTSELAFTVYRGGPYELWCGDFFELPRRALAGVTAVYDRASLVALPPEMRGRYADHTCHVVPGDATIFLISFEYDQREMDGPPFSVDRDEIAELYSDHYDIDVAARESVFERNADLRGRGLTWLDETVSILRRRS